MLFYMNKNDIAVKYGEKATFITNKLFLAIANSGGKLVSQMEVRIQGDPESCLDQFNQLLVPDLIKLDGYLMSLISLISQLGKLIKVVKLVLFCDYRLTPSDLCEDSESQPSFWNLSQEVLDTALFCESSFSVSNIINRFFVNL